MDRQTGHLNDAVQVAVIASDPSSEVEIGVEIGGDLRGKSSWGCRGLASKSYLGHCCSQAKAEIGDEETLIGTGGVGGGAGQGWVNRHRRRTGKSRNLEGGEWDEK